MTISRLVKKLEEYKEKHGDVEIYIEATLGKETFPSTVEEVRYVEIPDFKNGGYHMFEWRM